MIFVCENNLYAGAQRYEHHTKAPNIADRATGYAMPGVVVDDNDALAVYGHVSIQGHWISGFALRNCLNTAAYR